MHVLVKCRRESEIEGFIPKQTFTLKRNKKTHAVDIHIGQLNKHMELFQESQTNNSTDDIWYLCSSSVQGYSTVDSNIED
jgi:hypothetical protein